MKGRQMWRSVLLHEFPDEDIHSLQAVPGALTAASLALHPSGGSVTVTPISRFRYVLRTPLRDVIGVSCRLKLRYPFQGPAEPEPLIRLGTFVRLSVQPTASDQMLVRVKIAGTELRLALPVYPFPQFALLRFDWHTSGQVSVSVDGQLIGYHNALSASARFAVDDLSVGRGDPDQSLTYQRYEIGRLLVRVLTRSDALGTLARELPAIDVPDGDMYRRCRMRIMVDLQRKLDRLRNFMTAINQTLTYPWPDDAGPTERPSFPEVTRVHDLATTAVAALWRMLRSADFTNSDDFLAPFTQLLEILQRTRPDEFRQLIQELTQTPTVPRECREIVEGALEQGRHAFGPLLTLLAQADERITEIAERD
ncbi:hypothetical protein [Streptomyces canus]|uniref:hypothetical protein n=1 Tax=Streptomyces canus TaxID=58343 RepID=UPI002E366EB2|nr:hypothetical protein [Streptomyces canus]